MQPWRVTGDQGQTWHFGFTNVIYYFSEAGWWHTRLTSWHGLYLPGSEGTHCYQLLLITLKIPQPHPVANSRDLSGRSASFRTVLQSGTTEVNDFPTRAVRWSALHMLGWGLISFPLSVIFLFPLLLVCVSLKMGCLFTKNFLEMFQLCNLFQVKREEFWKSAGFSAFFHLSNLNYWKTIFPRTGLPNLQPAICMLP